MRNVPGNKNAGTLQNERSVHIFLYRVTAQIPDVELISVSEVVNKYLNEYLVVRRRVVEDGLILLCRYKTISSILKVRKES